MRRYAFAFLSVTLLISLLGLSGCGEKGPVTLKVSMVADWNNDGMKAALAKAEGITGYKTDVAVYPSTEFINMVKTKLVTGDVPDVLFTNVGLSQYPSEKLEPLDGASWISKVNQTTKVLMVRKDGKVVQAPFVACDQYGIVYNKKVFEKAGVTLPLKNYNELLAACEAIKKIGVTPISIPNKEVWTAQIWLLASLVNTFEKNGKLDMTVPDQILKNQVKPQDIPELVDRFVRLYALKEKGYVNSDYMSSTLQMSQKAVAEGTAGMMAGLGAFYGAMKTDYPDTIADTGFSLVNFSDGAPYACVGAANSFLSVPSAAKNKRQALKFLTTFVSEPVLAEYFNFIPGLPPYKDMKLPMSSWNQEMSELSAQYTTYDAFTTQLWKGEFWGDFHLRIQDLMAGKPAQQCIADWYGKYAEEMKAKKAEGF